MQSPPRLPLERHRLDNGLQIVLQPDRALPLVAVNLWYHVGSRDERPGRTGLAHLFEHMLFQGSDNVGTNDHFRYVQQVGGVANGSTWADRQHRTGGRRSVMRWGSQMVSSLVCIRSTGPRCTELAALQLFHREAVQLAAILGHDHVETAEIVEQGALIERQTRR